MNPDLLLMWRCIVAVAHADGKVHDAERTYLQRTFETMQRNGTLTAAGRALLENDLRVQQSPFVLLKQIKNPSYRSQVLYFALYLAKVDGVIDPSEQDLIDRLHAEVTGSDAAELRDQAQQALQDAPRNAALRLTGLVAFAEELQAWAMPVLAWAMPVLA